jgi:hypothetical protein
MTALGREASASDNLQLIGGYPDQNGSNFPGIYGVAVDPSFDNIRKGEVKPSCTATAISSTVLVTAAHCLKKSSQSLIYYILDYNLRPLFISTGGLLVGEAQAHPLSQFSSGASWRQPYDIAFIRVSVPTFTVTTSFLDREVSPGDQAALVGYGTSRENPSEGRQFGFNKVVSILSTGSIDPLGRPVRDFYNTLLLVSFDRELNPDPNNPTNARTIPGDSGGPLLVDGKIAGVLYGGAYWNQERDEANEEERGRFDDSIYVNPRTSSNQQYMRKLKAMGWDIPL